MINDHKLSLIIPLINLPTVKRDPDHDWQKNHEKRCRGHDFFMVFLFFFNSYIRYNKLKANMGVFNTFLAILFVLLRN